MAFTHVCTYMQPMRDYFILTRIALTKKPDNNTNRKRHGEKRHRLLWKYKKVQSFWKIHFLEYVTLLLSTKDKSIHPQICVFILILFITTQSENNTVSMSG